MTNLPSLHELLAHTHLLTERQRRQGSIGQIGPLLCVHAEGMRDGEPVALDRFFARDCSPASALIAMRNYGPERDHLLFVVDAPVERQRAFTRAGFRLVETQWLMACVLEDWQPATAPPGAGQVNQAKDAVDAILLSTIDGLEAITVDELCDPALMHYYAEADKHPIAYGRNAYYDGVIAWVSHLYTATQYRRLGYASVLMERILTDSAEAGVAQSLLLATPIAHSLYIRLGYLDIAPVAILQAPPALLRRRVRRG